MVVFCKPMASTHITCNINTECCLALEERHCIVGIFGLPVISHQSSPVSHVESVGVLFADSWWVVVGSWEPWPWFLCTTYWLRLVWLPWFVIRPSAIGHQQLAISHPPSQLPSYNEGSPCIRYIYIYIHCYQGQDICCLKNLELWHFQNIGFRVSKMNAVDRAQLTFQTSRDIFCLKNLDSFKRTTVRLSKMNALARAQLTFQILI